jgi:hypothetical protein
VNFDSISVLVLALSTVLMRWNSLMPFRPEYIARTASVDLFPANDLRRILRSLSPTPGESPKEENETLASLFLPLRLNRGGKVHRIISSFWTVYFCYS